MTALPADEAGLSRGELILSYHPLVRTIACRMARRLPPSVDVDELINVGILGLIDAVDRYDAGRGVPFKAYAEIRIQGAMIDALRSDDWVPRSVRRKSNRIEDIRLQLSRALGRDPSREEMASALDMSVDEYEENVRDARITRLVSLDVSTTTDGRTPLVESIGLDEKNAEDQLGTEQLKELVTHAVSCLPEKERLAVTKYYLQGLTLRQIGTILGVTESRACQLRGQGIKRLQYRLRNSTN